MKLRLLIAASLAAASFSSCNKKTDIAPVPGCFGPLPVPQTGQVLIQVQAGDGAPAVLDSFVVTDAAGIPLPQMNGRNVWGYLYSGAQANSGITAGGCVITDCNGIGGRYSIINDAWVPGHQNTKAVVQAKGFIAGHLVFDEAYTIAADELKVRKVAGKDVIVLP